MRVWRRQESSCDESDGSYEPSDHNAKVGAQEEEHCCSYFPEETHISMILKIHCTPP